MYLKKSQLKLLKWGWVKAETDHGGGGGGGGRANHHLCPLEKNFNRTLCIACSSGTFMSGNMKNLSHSFKNWKLLLKTTLKRNRISQYLDVA